jgi:hypothetical protein
VQAEVLRRYWLIVERAENWSVDKSNSFTFFGIGDRHLKSASKITTGDILISYISSGISKFADVRQAEKAGIHRIRRDVGYDSPFSQYIMTKSIIVLHKTKWLPISDIIKELEFTRSSADWRQLLRISLREISANDGKLLLSMMKSRASADEKP